MREDRGTLSHRGRRVATSPRGGRDYQKEWDGLVKAAKERLLAISHARMEIARLAIKACDIVHGGGGHWNDFKGQKTVTQFAAEIGMNYKTLIQWIKIRKGVHDKLPKGVYQENNFGAADRTRKRFKGVKLEDVPNKEVTKVYKQELDRKEDHYQIWQLIKRSAYLANGLEQGKLDVTKCRKEEVNELIWDEPHLPAPSTLHIWIPPHEKGLLV